MLRSLSAMFVVFGLLFAVPHLPAQAQSQRAYAPEDMRSLSRADQERVIRLEYSEQSKGRRIPDDQLRFYIDQINRSNWSFSRIRQDIATSLGGNGGGWNPGPGPGQSGSVLCESQNNRYRECRTNFRGNAVLTQNISQTRCVEGQNWGSRDGMVWVDRGCKGRFVQGSNNNSGQTLRCESQNGAIRTCTHNFRNNVVLSRQLSSTRCVEGQNWGQRRGSIWVKDGCRGEFTEGRGGWNPGPGNSNYSVTCSSANDRRSTCAWDSRQGRPMVIQQLSSAPCREGSTWGYSGNQIWVDRGCRARFGAR